MKFLYQKTLNSLKRISFYIPVTFYFILFGISIVLSYFYLNNKLVAPESSFTAVLQLLVSVIAVTTIIYISVGILSILIPWIFTVIVLKRKLLTIDLKTNISETEDVGNLQILISIHPILKPFLGFIKCRFQFDENQFTQKLSLVKKASTNFFSKSIEGNIYWQLPQIKEYNIQKVIIYFEDYLQFFSLPIQYNIQSHIISKPKETSIQKIYTQPRKTEENQIRITDLRKVEGEYLNYKNFENNDDVRRIVWKIYAKNKELVIRTPEILDPFASHVYLYASFHSIFNFSGNSILEIPFLNYYKTCIWSAYKQLCKQNFEIKFVADQSYSNSNLFSELNEIKNHISICNWQMSKSVNEYCKIADASILIISSLNNPQEIEHIIEQSSNNISVIFIKLSNYFSSNKITDWIEWLFIQKEKNDIEKYKAQWNFNSLKSNILNNELKLEKVIQNQILSSKLERV